VELVTLAHDPQTSGGLLAAVPRAAVEALQHDLSTAGIGHWAIGRVEASATPGVRLA
jgi:selenide,water dikinase